jgi:hypothetical protein
MPTRARRGVLLTLSVISVPEQVAILRQGVNDLTKTVRIVIPAEESTEVLPTVANRVTGIRGPTRAPRGVLLPVSVISVPE